MVLPKYNTGNKYVNGTSQKNYLSFNILLKPQSFIVEKFLQKRWLNVMIVIQYIKNRKNPEKDLILSRETKHVLQGIWK